MSSRLFQNIRERQGLAYSVFSEPNLYQDAGSLSVYAGTSPENLHRLLESVLGEFRTMKDESVTPEELKRAKDHLKGSLMLGLESTSSRMSNLARQHLYYGRFYTPDEVMARVDAVTEDQIREVAQICFQPESLSLTALGKLNGFAPERAQLVC